MRFNTSYSTILKTFFIVAFALTLSTETSYGQLFSKKPSRKSMEAEITKLRKTVDSLKQELDLNIPISDTVSTNDTINPGALSFFDSEDFIKPTISTDSLLSIWYVQKNLSIDDNISVNLDSSVFTSDVPDSVFISRLKAINSFIPLPYNNVIKNHIIYYTQKIPNKIDLILGLSSYYMPIFEEIFDEYNLPKELKVMAIIESALNPRATSRVNAKGMWQFMYRTALQYNLKINSYVDERLDPVASSHAAAKYLKDAYTIFGDWSLAIASYNCGAGNVNKAIRRAGGSRDFWKIYPYLPRETRGYVPSFVAALYTINYYKEHRITPRPISLPAHVDTFMIYKPLHFGQISELTGIPKEELSDLNPQYINEIIPGTESGMVLNLPYNYTSAFVDNEQIIYGYKDSIFFNPIIYNESKTSAPERTSITHTVRSGETLSKIARKYRVKLSDLQSWNRVKSTIKPGQRLVIYTSGAPRNSLASSSVSSSSDKASSSNGYVYYTIKKGDTLWEISRKFDGVTLNDLMKLNGFTQKSKIKPGDKIKIKSA
ncbi:MAG: LysM peptidoglycan-binding domain-containing protein [Rikenellaceae bacterium]